MSSSEMDRGGGGQQDKSRAFINISKYTAIGLEFPSTVLGGLVLGYLLDRYFGTSPWLAVGVTLLALVGAFVRLVVMLKRFSGKDQQ